MIEQVNNDIRDIENSKYCLSKLADMKYYSIRSTTWCVYSNSPITVPQDLFETFRDLQIGIKRLKNY